MSHIYRQLKDILYLRNALSLLVCKIFSKLSKQILFIMSKIFLLEERSDCYYAALSVMFIIIFIQIHVLIYDWL
jgi:hypothetical protein